MAKILPTRSSLTYSFDIYSLIVYNYPMQKKELTSSKVIHPEKKEERYYLKLERVDPRKTPGITFVGVARRLASYDSRGVPPEPLLELHTLRMVRMENGGMCLSVDERSRPNIPALIAKGAVADDLVDGWATFRRKYGDGFFAQYDDIFEAAERARGVEFKSKPLDRKPLASRLNWTTQDPEGREDEATRRRIDSTDLIRGTLLPRYHARGLGILPQIRLVHRAHMRGNEHVLLQPNQARRMLETSVEKVDRLAGVIRSPQRLSVDVHLGSMNTLCATYAVTPSLMEGLGKAADTLFPLDGINPAVNEDNIYNVVSAFQYAIAMIHPFYEANGRTSEDTMYALWQRRPDLAHTVRYPSSDGRREGNMVDERDWIINQGATQILRNIATSHFNFSPLFASTLEKHADLEKALEDDRDSKTDNRLAYITRFAADMILFIARINTPEVLYDKTIVAMADNLKRSSPTYYFSSTK